jgi:hypothetical protein
MKRHASAVLIVALLTSCASVSHGRDEVISVDSDPAGAQATLACANGVTASGVTPARLTIPRKADGCHVDVTRDGMRAQQVTLSKEISRAFWLNFIGASVVPLVPVVAFSDGGGNSSAGALLAVGAAGAAGFLIDRVTGAMYDHEPHAIKVTLQPRQAP